MIRNRKDEFQETSSLGRLKTPTTWHSIKIAHAFEMIGSGTTPSSQEESYFSASAGIPWVTTGELREKVIKSTRKYVTDTALAEYSALQVHPKGALLIAMYGATIGRLGILGIPATTNQACCVLSSPRMLEPKFLFFWFIAFKKDLIALYSTGGGQPNISQSVISSLRVPAPSILEQQKIAQFLDFETAKTDALIDEQKRLIELLKEKRQAVISHAVTKGLNPNAPMRESGVEWLGEVPRHWDVTKLGYLGNAIIGLTYSPDDIIDEGGTIVLRSTNIQNGHVSLHDNVHVSKKINEKLRLRIGDILICSRNGSRALIGKNALIGESAVGLTFGAFTTVFRSEYNPFLKYIFDSKIFSAQAGLFMTTTVNQLTTGTLNQMQIALPPVSEQSRIIDYLDSEVKRVEVLTAECKSSLALLQERRSAIISAAVTGKIDVRDWQPPQGSDTVEKKESAQTEMQHG